VCGHTFDRFRDRWNRAEALCWRCGSHERHRAQWLLLSRRRELLTDAKSLLHFAPEWSLRHHLAHMRTLRYVTADLLDPDVDLRLDLTSLTLPDACFDAVICSHVLEHVEDDRAAMSELHRITRKWCLVMVPLDLSRETTLEDPTITTPEARQATFWQEDHVRLYGRDIEQRLTHAGFVVERIEPMREFGEAAFQRCGLLASDWMWLCRPSTASSTTDR
jgi:SAM-dependent methyltransferase